MKAWVHFSIHTGRFLFLYPSSFQSLQPHTCLTEDLPSWFPCPFLKEHFLHWHRSTGTKRTHTLLDSYQVLSHLSLKSLCKTKTFNKIFVLPRLKKNYNLVICNLDTSETNLPLGLMTWIQFLEPTWELSRVLWDMCSLPLSLFPACVSVGLSLSACV